MHTLHIKFTGMLEVLVHVQPFAGSGNASQSNFFLICSACAAKLINTICSLTLFSLEGSLAAQLSLESSCNDAGLQKPLLGLPQDTADCAQAEQR